MNELDKYKESFYQAFELEEDADVENLKYQSIEQWDSVGHMTLMATLEDVFNFTFEPDDIIDFSSYKKGLEILRKYGINF